MKTIKLISIIFTLFLAACSKDDADNQKPLISNAEIGHDGKFQAGAAIHIEFEVEDNDKLDYYLISIHPEGLHKRSSNSEWAFEKKFYEINGLKNYTVHNHEIVVPADADLTMYHVDLKVADMAGNVAEYYTELQLTTDDLSHE